MWIRGLYIYLGDQEEIRYHSMGQNCTLFISSTKRVNIGATVGGVGMLLFLETV